MEFAIARSCVILVGVLPHTYFLIKHLRLRKDYLVKVAGAPALASIPMALLIWMGLALTRGTLEDGGPLSLLALAGLAVTGAAIYWGALRTISPKFATQAIQLFGRALRDYRA